MEKVINDASFKLGGEIEEAVQNVIHILADGLLPILKKLVDYKIKKHEEEHHKPGDCLEKFSEDSEPKGILMKRHDD